MHLDSELELSHLLRSFVESKRPDSRDFFGNPRGPLSPEGFLSR